jgi:hypothetical protein
MVEKVLKVFPVQFENRNGGYTRIIPIEKRRKGDGSEMCYIEYLDGEKVETLVNTLKETGGFDSKNKMKEKLRKSLKEGKINLKNNLQVVSEAVVVEAPTITTTTSESK